MQCCAVCLLLSFTLLYLTGIFCSFLTVFWFCGVNGEFTVEYLPGSLVGDVCGLYISCDTSQPGQYSCPDNELNLKPKPQARIKTVILNTREEESILLSINLFGFGFG